jgi:hypothetical protein
MRVPPFALVSLAVAASLVGRTNAQNDDCSGAISVAYGANGPFTNAGSTTSPPAWPCGAGDNDVWFSYLAPGTGPLTADTCGASYDSTLQIFDGTAGCGGLVDLGCNDDACSLQSSMTIATVTVGTTYYIRVGGFYGATGTFMLNINGPIGSGTVATAASYGTGCVAQYASFYEHFPTAASFDLSSSGMSLLYTGTGYIALPGLLSYLPPSAAATILPLSDDSETSVTLSTALVVPGGATSNLTVCSNGYVSVAAGNGTSYTPDVAAMLNSQQTGWWIWHDYNPGVPSGGQVKFEEVAGIAYITWDGVVDFGSTSVNTFQFQFELATGIVHCVWQSMSPFGNGYLVGYSPGGASLDPGNLDISATLPNTFTTLAGDVLPLQLAASARPVTGNTISLVTTHIGSTAQFGAVLISLTQWNPGLDLSNIGMAGCFLYQGAEMTLLFVPLGAPNQSIPIVVPNAPGIHVYLQSVVFDPAAGLTTFGAIASNGLDLNIGTL